MPTILIADDDADHRELLTIALTRLDYRVVAVADASSAIRLIAAGGLDAVLLDVRMPGESGIQLCRRLRAEPATATLPIMVISADVCDTRVLAALEAGADDYVTKPYRRAELATRLDSLLHRRAPNRAPTTAVRAAGALRSRVPVAPFVTHFSCSS